MMCRGLRFLCGVLGLWIVAWGAIAEETGSAAAQKKRGTAPLVTDSGGKYIRYAEKGKEAKLQTAIAHFIRESDGAEVDLIAVIHVADQAYYDELDKRMAAYDAVLYEMVGGPYNPGAQKVTTAERAPLEGLTLVHGMIRSLLKLEYQKDGIDYRRKNFVHADVDWDKFKALSEERNQTIATWFERAMKLAESETVPGIPKDENESRAMMGTLIGALVNGDAVELKRTLAPVLSEAEILITKLEGEDGTVLVTERNKVALEVVQEQLRLGKLKLSVFYGGAHMPDLEKRLIGLGFHKEKTEWLTAWDIRDDPSVAKSNLLGELLKDEEIGSILNSAMKLLDQATRPAAPEK